METPAVSSDENHPSRLMEFGEQESTQLIRVAYRSGSKRNLIFSQCQLSPPDTHQVLVLGPGFDIMLAEFEIRRDNPDALELTERVQIHIQSSRGPSLLNQNLLPLLR